MYLAYGTNGWDISRWYIQELSVDYWLDVSHPFLDCNTSVWLVPGTTDDESTIH